MMREFRKWSRGFKVEGRGVGMVEIEAEER